MEIEPTDLQADSPEPLFWGEEVFSLISDLADQILSSGKLDDQMVVVGIANGGIALSNLLRRLLERQTGLSFDFGIVEISFHRDDIGSHPIPIVAHPTDIPVSIDGKTLLLVDDVIASGRTVRAAINEIFDIGRPEKILFAALLDRGGRKLPLRPDFLADQIEISADQDLRVHIDEENPKGHKIEITRDEN